MMNEEQSYNLVRMLGRWNEQEDAQDWVGCGREPCRVRLDPRTESNDEVKTKGGVVPWYRTRSQVPTTTFILRCHRGKNDRGSQRGASRREQSSSRK